jgi:long-chain acyl-CoA synthetase
MKLFQNFRNYQKNIALTNRSNKKITYQDLNSICEKIKKNLKKKSLVLIFAGNNLGSIISYIFSQKFSFPAILINDDLEKKEVLKIVDLYQPKFIFCEKKIFSKFKEKKFKKNFNFLNIVIYENTNTVEYKIHQKLALLLTTSGTMGTAKFVKLSYENLKKNTDSIIKYLNLNNKSKSITSLPYSYSYMLSVINTHLESGGSIHVTNESIIQKNFWSDFKKHKIDSFNGVPYSYEILLKFNLNKLFKNLKIKYFTQAGGKLDIEKLKEIIMFSKKVKAKFFTMYGQTEASPRISYLSPKFALKKIGSIGKSLKNTKMLIINNRNKEIKKSFTKGEIAFQGKNIFIGYSKNYNDLIIEEKIPLLKTGDLGYFDNENFFYVTGRKNKIGKIFGVRIDLEELEIKLQQLKYTVYCLIDDNKLFILYTKKYSSIKLIQIVSNIIKQNQNHIKCRQIKNLPRNKSNKINFGKLMKIIK